jgi:hypothetical protein
MQYLSVGVALLLEYTAPIILIGYHWVRTRRRPAALVFVGAAAAIAGLVLVLDPGQDAVISPIGVAWGLAAALCACGYFLLSENDEPRTTCEAPLHPLVLITAGTGVGGLLILLLGLTGLMPLRATTHDTSLGGLAVPWWLPVLGLMRGAEELTAAHEAAYFARMPQDELRIDLVRGRESLPAPFREVILLRDMEQLTISEVADRLGITREACKSRIHRGRALMREYLQADAPRGAGA